MTFSTTARTLARTAIQISCSGSAAPRYSTSSGASPRTLASGPSTARMTSASEISSAGCGEPVAAVGAALGAHEPGVAQVGEDVLEELVRDLLGRRAAASPLTGPPPAAASSAAARRA